MFSENLFELLPNPIFDDPAVDSDSNSFRTEDESSGDSESDIDSSDDIEEANRQSTPFSRRPKKRKDWIWTLGKGGGSPIHEQLVSSLEEAVGAQGSMEPRFEERIVERH